MLDDKTSQTASNMDRFSSKRVLRDLEDSTGKSGAGSPIHPVLQKRLLLAGGNANIMKGKHFRNSFARGSQVPQTGGPLGLGTQGGVSRQFKSLAEDQLPLPSFMPSFKNHKP